MIGRIIGYLAAVLVTAYLFFMYDAYVISGLLLFLILYFFIALLSGSGPCPCHGRAGKKDPGRRDSAESVKADGSALRFYSEDPLCRKKGRKEEAVSRTYPRRGEEDVLVRIRTGDVREC